MRRSHLRPRVVFDCNVLIQAVASSDGPAGESLGLLERNLIHVYLSRAVLRELRDALNYPTVRASLPDLTDERITVFIQQLVFKAEFLRTPRHIFDYPRVRQDERYIDLAAAAQADYLVSHDKDLLSLATDHTLLGKQFRQKLRRLRVVKPTAFLAALKSDEIID